MFLRPRGQPLIAFQGHRCQNYLGFFPVCENLVTLIKILTPDSLIGGDEHRHIDGQPQYGGGGGVLPKRQSELWPHKQTEPPVSGTKPLTSNLPPPPHPSEPTGKVNVAHLKEGF